jgi:hypothetical protein
MPPAPAIPRKDIGMEGMVAKWYAADTAKWPDDFTRLAQRIGNQLRPGSAVLVSRRVRAIFASSLRN